MQPARLLRPVEQPTGRLRPWLARAVVCAVVLVVFWRTLHYGLYLDDQHHVRPWTLDEVLGVFHGPFDPLGIEPVYYRPLVVVSFAVDWALWGYGTTGWHATNIVLHSLAAVAVLELLRRARLGLWVATAGAVLFALIPANVATVVYISERSDAMVAIFSVIALLAVYRWFHVRRPRWLVVACLAYVLAIGSKEVGIATIGLVAIWWWFLNLPDPAPTSDGRRPSIVQHWRGEVGGAWSAIAGRSVRRSWLLVVGPMAAITVAFLAFRAVVLPNGALGESYDASEGPVRGFVTAVFATFKGMPWEVRAWSLPLLVGLVVVAFIVGPTSRHWRVVVLGVAWVICCCVPLARLGRVEPRLLYVAEIGAALVVAGVLGVLAEAWSLRRAGAEAPTRLSKPAAWTAAVTAATVMIVGYAAVTAPSNVEAQDQFEPGSPKMLAADLRIWETPRYHERFPEHYMVLIEQRLRDAGMIP